MSDKILGLDAANRRNLMRGFLAVALLAAFQFSLYWLFQWQVPEKNRDMVVYMLGQLSGMVMLALGYFFSTSKSSSDKNDIMHSLTQHKPVETDQLPGATGMPDDGMRPSRRSGDL